MEVYLECNLRLFRRARLVEQHPNDERKLLTIRKIPPAANVAISEDTGLAIVRGAMRAGDHSENIKTLLAQNY